MSTPANPNNIQGFPVSGDQFRQPHQTAWILTAIELLGLSLGILLGVLMPNQFSLSWQRWVFAWVVVFVAVHLVVRLAARDDDWLSLDKIFIMAYLYFHFDYLSAYLVGIAEFESKAIPFAKSSNLTTYLLSMCLFMFIFGYDLFWTANKHNVGKKEMINSIRSFRSMIPIGKYLTVVGFGMIFFFIFRLGLGNLLSRDYGFSLFYSGEYETILFTGGRLILSAGIMFLVLDWLGSGKNLLEQSLMNWLLFFLVFIYMIALLFLFSVRSWILLDIVLPAFFSYHYLYKKVKFRSFVIGLASFLVFSVVVQLSRGVDTRTFSGFADTLSYNFDVFRDDFAALLTIQFRTYRNVNWTIELMDMERSWFYGRTIIGGVLQGIPVLGKYLVGDWYDPPALWLARVADPWAYENSEGIGFSLPAEAYMNFGLVGAFIIFLLLGLFSARFYSNVIQKKDPKIFSYLLYISFSTHLMFALRQSTSSISRPLISITIIYSILRALCQII